MKILPINNFTTGQNTQNSAKKQPLLMQNCADTRSFSPIPLNLYKNQISFGRTLEEHNSWGVTINDNGGMNFKTYTYPDAKKVYVEVLKNPNKENINEISKRALDVKRNAENADVLSISPINKNSEIFELNNLGNGIFSKENIKNLSSGQPYRLIIVDKNNNIENVKDPYSKEQRQIKSWSIIHNQKNYKWNDADWMAGKIPQRISRTNSNLVNLNSARIMEINIPTITPKGDFKSAKKVLKEIADKKLANTIEIMPLENCYSKQWGYDGVDKFAINERLGTSEELKELIDYAHKLKLNIVIDMVPNHLGTDGDTLRKTGPYEKEDGAFGAKFNWEGKDSKEVRNWMANAALNWVKEYHADGLRLDMTKPLYMGSDITLKQIVAEVNEHYPDTFMIAEDGEGNRAKITTPINSSGSHQRDLEHLDAQIEKIQKGEGIERIDDIGFDSEWDFVFLHELENAIKNSKNFNIYSFDAALRNSHNRVSYPISHDEQGNLDGTSFVVKRATNKLDLSYSIRGKSEADIGQKAAHATQHLLELYASGELDKMSDEEFKASLDKLDITRHVSKEEIAEAYKYGIEKTKLATGAVNSFPGPKMFFQGFANGSLNYFKFFREFSDDNEHPEIKSKINIEKGYDIGMTGENNAYADNMPNRIRYSSSAAEIMNKTEQFAIDTCILVDENPALQDGQIVKTVIHEQSLVHAVHAKKDDNEIFSVKNFSDNNFSEYNIVFPKGKWVEVINSADKKYAGNGNFMNNDKKINGNNAENNSISLPSNSIVYFKKIA